MDPWGNSLCIYLNWPVFILFIDFLSSLNLVCRPTLLPAAMAHFLRRISRSFPPPGSPLPITHPNLGAFGSMAPGENSLLRKTYSIQIIERLKVISKNKPIYKYILKSISLYLRAMSSFVSKLILCFSLLRNNINVTKLAIGIHWNVQEKLLSFWETCRLFEAFRWLFPF